MLSDYVSLVVDGVYLDRFSSTSVAPWFVCGSMQLVPSHVRPVDKVDSRSRIANLVHRLVEMTALAEFKTYLTMTTPVAFDRVSLG